MTNFRLDLEYDGTDFRGWQVQPGQRTVQGELQQALWRLLHQEISVEGAGRTDAGVHALGQVAKITCAGETSPELVQRALPGLLPADIHVRRVRVVPDGFSARHSAVARSYRYRLHRGPSAHWRRFALTVPEELQAEPMIEAARLFLGENDFTAFAASAAGTPCVCVVERSRVRATGPWIHFDITANRFVHNMVRRLTGALVEVGRGRLEVASIAEILRRGDRRLGGPCLPPQGLFLVAVRYAGEPPQEPDAIDLCGGELLA